MADVISGSVSIERLRPHSSSSSSNSSSSTSRRSGSPEPDSASAAAGSAYAYENCLATADDEVDEEASQSPSQPRSATSISVEAAAEPSARQGYELSAAHASCWLRHLLCSAVADMEDCDSQQPEAAEEEAAQTEAAAAAADAVTQEQLDEIFQSFADLSASDQALVPARLQPPRLRLLRARQRAVAACAAEAAALARRRRRGRAEAALALGEKLAGCHQRLRLVGRCAAGLASRIRGGGGGGDSLDDAVDESGGVRPDLRLLVDSAARARRSLDELLLPAPLGELANQREALGRTAERQLRRCARCLAVRADSLAEFAAAAMGDCGGGASGGGLVEAAVRTAQEGVDEALARCAAAAAAALSSSSSGPGRLERALLEMKLAEDLVNHAIAASDEAAERTGSWEAEMHQQQQQQQHQADDLQHLLARLSSVREPLKQLAAASRSRRRLRRQLARRSHRLRHLCELASLARQSLGERLYSRLIVGGPAAFVEPDEEEATVPTTPALLQEAAAALADLRRRSAAATAEAAKQLLPQVMKQPAEERRLAAMAVADERLLAQTASAREAFAKLLLAAAS